MCMRMEDFLQRCQRLVVITGAGCSTASGIGDYRDEQGDWKRTEPVHHQQFMSSLHWRQRYWARSQAGYVQFMAAQPNAAHRVLAAWEQAGHVRGLITQNVDRLHQRAGHRNVIDLHGRLDEVVCMNCEDRSSRGPLQPWLERNNPTPDPRSYDLAPDGDADLHQYDYASVCVPDCAVCGGILKPDVVFFGASVPRSVVAQAYQWVEQADGVLVVGSSLMVFSSYRFVRRAAERGIPIAAINRGRTRADELLSAKLEQDCGAALVALSRQLGRPGGDISAADVVY